MRGSKQLQKFQIQTVFSLFILDDHERLVWLCGRNMLWRVSFHYDEHHLMLCVYSLKIFCVWSALCFHTFGVDIILRGYNVQFNLFVAIYTVAL